MTRKIDLAGGLERQVRSPRWAALAWSVSVLLLIPVILLAGVLAVLATVALALWRRRPAEAHGSHPAVLAPVVTLGQLPEPVLTGSGERVQERAA